MRCSEVCGWTFFHQWPVFICDKIPSVERSKVDYSELSAACICLSSASEHILTHSYNRNFEGWLQWTFESVWYCFGPCGWEFFTTVCLLNYSFSEKFGGWLKWTLESKHCFELCGWKYFSPVFRGHSKVDKSEFFRAS